MLIEMEIKESSKKEIKKVALNLAKELKDFRSDVQTCGLLHDLLIGCGLSSDEIEKAAHPLPENNKIIIQPGKTYQCKNGAFVTISNGVNNGLYYRHKASNVVHETEGIRDAGYHEVWTSEGVAYHYDCGWNIVREI